MSPSDSLRRTLVARAAEADETEVLTFVASRGPWFGFNGTTTYVVTARSLWCARNGLRTLFGGEPTVTRWPVEACDASLSGTRGILLRTPAGQHSLKLPSAAEARAAAAALGG